MTFTLQQQQPQLRNTTPLVDGESSQRAHSASTDRQVSIYINVTTYARVMIFTFSPLFRLFLMLYINVRKIISIVDGATSIMFLSASLYFSKRGAY